MCTERIVHVPRCTFAQLWVQAKAQRSMKRMGKLSPLIYIVAILGVWHFWWQVKKDIREPLLYACGLALLLGYRLWKQRRVSARLSAAHRSRTGAASAAMLR